jgi:hypothetical protein
MRKLGRATELMMHSKVLGKTDHPRAAKRPAKPGNVTTATRREVCERDAEQCTFVDETGQRCPARGFLQLHHSVARAMGGPGDAANVRLLCKPHNLLEAERVFGREYVRERIRARRRRSRSKK